MAPDLPARLASTKENLLLWTLLIGNFVIGTGIMLVPGTLNDIAASLRVGVATAGQLITAGAITVAVGAPLLAALVGRMDRRLLLSASMLWFALLHVACALASDYSNLLILRVLAVISAAIFTPQAAAVAGMLVAPQRRGRAIATVFLGWSMASVLGSPLAALIGGHYGWRMAFWMLALLAVLCACWVWRVIPTGVRPPAISGVLWRQTLLSPVMMTTVAVTALSATGQFTVFAYFSPYVAQVLKGSPGDLALLLAVFGAFGVVGSFAVSRGIDRMGPPQAVMMTLGLMALSMLLWPFGSNVWMLCLVCIPWGLGCFSCNSAQQARLVTLAPAMASVSVALNTSAMYLGQGMGSALGGMLVNQGQIMRLHWAGLAGLLLAMGMSLLAGHIFSQQRAPNSL
jgi:predicted MFS family arabinose efflux permease